MLVGDNADPRPPMRDDLYSAASNLKSEIHHLDEVNDCMPELQESYRKTTTRRFYDVTALLLTHQNVSLTPDGRSAVLPKRIWNHSLALFTQPFNPKPHHVARSQINRRLLSQPNSGRRPRRNNISRLQAHKPAQIADQMSHPKHHRRCRSILVPVPVQIGRAHV